MATARKKPPPQQKPADNDNLANQVESLRRVVILIVLVSLAVSASLNVYLVRQNVALSQDAAEYEKRLIGYTDNYQFLQRLVNDLRGLARTNEDVRNVLKNYHEILVANKIYLQPSAPNE